MNTLSASFDSIRPAARYVGNTGIISEPNPPTRISYDHRLFFATEDEADFWVRGVRYSLSRGSALIILSGTPYQIQPSRSSVSLFCVNFDFFSRPGQEPPLIPLPMTSPEKYHPAERVEEVHFTDGFLETPVLVPELAELVPTFHQMKQEADRGQLLAAAQLSALLTICLNCIFRYTRQSRPYRPNLDHADILEYVHAHCTESLSNQSIGQAFHYHPNYIGQIIRERTGLPLHRYILQLRIRKAMELILNEELSIEEISACTGFCNPSYFTQYFRRSTGYTPADFRRYRNQTEHMS